MSKYLKTYKIINIGLLSLFGLLYLVIELYFDTLCTEVLCLYEYQYSYYDPLSKISKCLVFMLVALLIVPSDIFRKWLWYVFPVMLIATTYVVSEVSVYSSGILSISRARTAELSMQFFALVTLLFVLGHLLYAWWGRYQMRKRPQS